MHTFWVKLFCAASLITAVATSAPADQAATQQKSLASRLDIIKRGNLTNGEEKYSKPVGSLSASQKFRCPNGGYCDGYTCCTGDNGYTWYCPFDGYTCP